MICPILQVGASHPCILEAANNLAAAVHEEQAKGGRDQEQVRLVAKLSVFFFFL